jgi:sodium transport system permease protein
MGAFFPAVDLTAGEKERSTAETTLLLPVSRMAVLHGKILAVCFSAVLATALNLTALGLSVSHLLGMLGGDSLPAMTGFPLLALVAVAPLALLFSFFVSSVLTGVAALAKNFEEGQALLGPVQILFIVPALVGVIPGVQLTVPLCFVPVVNVSLAFRSMLLGQGQSGEYALVALALLLYGLLSTRLAVKLLSRESARLGTLSLSNLLGALRPSSDAS